MWIIGAFITGLIIGGVIAVIVSRFKSIGSLVVDHSDPEDGPYLFLELRIPPYVVMRKKYVTTKVKNKNYISQK